LAPVDNTNNTLSEQEDKDLNLSATDNAPTEKAMAENKPTSGLHIIETFEEFEKGLQQQDYEMTESQLDNPCCEVLRWHYKLGHKSFRHLQWIGNITTTPGQLSGTSVCRLLLWESLQMTPERKGVTKQK
jgi:hypothetical protein